MSKAGGAWSMRSFLPLGLAITVAHCISHMIQLEGSSMRAFAFSLAVLCSTTVIAAAPAPKDSDIVADANAPKGKLPDLVAPTAYRLDFTVIPENERFSGHDEIDVTLKQAAKSIYMHGRDLSVTKAVAVAGGKTIPAKWVQVD